MHRKFHLTFLAVTLAAISFSQADDNKNISIQKAVEEYKFVKGDKEHPVQIKQVLEATYLCNEFRTTIPIVEFYNNEIEITDVDIRVNGDKAKYIYPKKDYYNIDGIFYSDARVCYFGLPLEKKGTTSMVRFEKKSN